MNKRSQQRKLTAWLILLTFLFTSIMPTNIGSWNSTAEAATYDTATNTITLTVGESYTLDASDKFPSTKSYSTNYGTRSFERGNTSWNSDDSNIATVSRTGLTTTITGLTAGTTEITASTVYSRYYSTRTETSTWYVRVVAATEQEQPMGTDQIDLTKTATDKDKNANGEQIFDIALTVQGATVHEKKLLDVVLILDNSDSMTSSLITATENAAKTFVDTIFSNENIDARIAVVRYGTTAAARDFATNNSWDTYGTRYGIEHYSNSQNLINGAIEALDGSGGSTNTEGAFLVANNLAQNKRTGAEHITVFMTDGVPTQHYNNQNGTSGGSSYTSLSDYNEALSAAIALSENSVVYNVALTAGLARYPYDNLIEGKFMSQPPYPMTQDSNSDRRTPQFSSTPSTSYAKAYYNIASSNANAIATEMAKVYADIATEAMNLATGKVVDVIPADFALTDVEKLKADALAAGYGITVTPNADGTTTVEFTGVEAKDTPTVLPVFEVKYTGNGYGAVYTNMEATYEGTLYNDEPFEKAFPKPVAGVHPKTVDDTDTALVNETILIDVAYNDPFNQLVVPGYTVSDYTIIITDANGIPLEYTDAAHQFTAVAKDGKVEFVSSTDTTKEFYYVVKANITQTGENFAINGKTELVSRPTKVTVTLVPTINIAVEKVWKAPAGTSYPSITVNLLQDGEVYESVVLPAGTTTYTFTNLPAKTTDLQHVYQYTVTENAVAGYVTAINPSDTANAAKYEITNTITGTMDITGTKTWHDGGKLHNNANEVTLILERNVNGGVYETVTVNPYWSGNNYRYVNLPMYDGEGNLYNYLVTESAIAGYKSVKDGNNFINTELIDISGTKTWIETEEDKNIVHDNATEIVLTLSRTSADGTQTDILADVKPEWNGAVYAFKNLEKYDSKGGLYNYKVSEQIIHQPGNPYYQTVITGFDITNKSEDIKNVTTELRGQKIWVDGGKTHNNADEVNLILERKHTQTDGTESAWETVAITNGISMHWDGNVFHYEGLPKYHPDCGGLYDYRVRENGVINNELTINNVTYVVTQNGNTITNTIKQEPVTISGNKTWIDDGNKNNTRPSSITVNLLENGSKVQEQTVTADMNWAYAFRDLPKYDAAGYEITYTVTENPVNGYDTVIDGYNIKNTIKQEYISISGTKTWIDGNNKSNSRPSSIIVNLLANGKEVKDVTVKPNTDGDWEYTFKDLPKYDENGAIITYAVTEDAVKGYTMAITGYDIANSITDPQDVEVAGEKIWIDGNNQNGERPESIIIRLFADGKDTGKYVTVTAADNWKWKFTSLDKYDAYGFEILYSVKEDAVNGYITEYHTDDYDVVNRLDDFYKPTEVLGTKVWVDGNITHNNAEALTLILQRTIDGKIWTTVDNARYVWRDNDFHYHNLAKYDANGYLYQYRVLEDGVVNGAITVNGIDYIADSFVADASNSYTLKNSVKQEQITVTGTKIWQDSVDRNHDNASELTLTLTRTSDKPGAEPETVNAKVTWKGDTYSFSGLDKYDAEGYVYAYNVAEAGVVNGEITINVNGEDVRYQVTQNGNDVINTELITIEGKKIWDDDNNRDGKRPSTVTIWLWANQVKQTSATANEAGEWGYRFENLPAYVNGHKVVYTVTEEAVPGYTSQTVNGYDVKNTYAPAMVDIHVQKTWEDADNQDGIRPKSIRVMLLANGKTVDEATLMDRNNWYHHFTNLPKNENGVPIVYTVQEAALPADSGYVLKDMHQEINGVWHIINAHAPETVDIVGTKTWDDANNQDGKRPVSVTINLLADGKIVASDTVTAVNDWSYSFDDYPKYAAGEIGRAIVYTISEDPVAGYTTKVNGYNVTNSYKPETTEATVQKVWDDADNQDGKRPAELKVTLSNGKEVILNKANGWKATVSNLPMYKDGKVINYTWTEASVNGYTLTETVTNGTVTTLTNTHTPEIVNIPITKVWNDNNNQDGKRPDAITLQLYADGVKVNNAQITLDTELDGVVNDTDKNGNTIWSYVWKDLDKYNNGKEIVYRVREVNPSNNAVVTNGHQLGEYTVNYVRANDGAITITNSYVPETITVKMQKAWNDNNNQDGSRPHEIYVNLLADGVVVTSDASGNAVGNVAGFPGVHKVDQSTEWAKAIANLPVYNNGRQIEYTWGELQKQTSQTGEAIYVNATDGKVIFKNADNKTFIYDFAYIDNGIGKDGIHHATITNTYEPETVKVVVNKTWVVPAGENNVTLPVDGDVKVTLLKNNNAVAGETKGFEWKEQPQNPVNGPAKFESKTIVWEDLPRYENGVEIVWDVAEKLDKHANEYVISEHVTKEVVNGVYTITIDLTNTYDLTHRSLLVNKIWEDNDNQDGKRPNEITVQLYYKTDNGNEWIAVPDNNAPTDTPNSTELTASNKADFFSTVDGNVQLTAAVGRASNLEWGYIWDNLPQYLNHTQQGGTEITYKVVEDIPAGYDSDPNDGDNIIKVDEVIEDVAEGTWALSLTNYHEVEETSITVHKVWADNNNQDGKRPETVTVRLYANGVSPYETAPEQYKDKYQTTLSAADYWKYTFTELPKYHNGQKIIWTVREMYKDNHVRPGGTVENGYVVAYDVADETANSITKGDLIITNTYIPETISIPVTKIWNDADNQDGIRPETVTVKLFANGVEVETLTIGVDNDEVLVDGKNQWTASFTNLPKYADGEEIVYTITEDEVDGYTALIDGFEITNTHMPEETEATVKKVWDDADNQDGKRPDSLTVTLSNGTEVTLSEANDWSATVDDLPVYEAGQKIEYTWTEGDMPDGYELTDTSVNGTVTTLTNSYATETVKVSGEKTWIDGNNAEGTRPESITVNLFAGSEFVKSVDVTAADNWSYSFTDLPKFADGEEIRYTISENEVAGYDTTYSGDYGYDITNIIKQQHVEVFGEKIWDAPEDLEVPVAEITIKLFRDGVEADTATVTAEDGWTYAFTGLDKYDLTDGHVYEYTVEEVTVVDGFDAEVVQIDDYHFDIINTYDRSGTTEVSVQKVWDFNGMDVTSPSAITVELYQNDVLHSRVNISEDDGWALTFKDLPKYDANHKAFIYEVKEVPVNGYDSAVTGNMTDGFVITNTLQLGAPGSISVTKEVTGDKAPVNAEFKFELHVQLHPEGSNMLFNLRDELTLEDAATALNDAIDEAENSVMLVTSPSQYAFYLTEQNDGESQAVMALEFNHTSPSAILFEENGPVVTPADVTTDSMYEWISNVTSDVVADIHDLSMEYPELDVHELLAMLKLGLDEEDGFALALDYDAVWNLITAARAYNALEVPEAVVTTTPSALKIFMNGSTTPCALEWDEDGYWKVAFKLAHGDTAYFDIEATTGSAIDYRIVEILDEVTQKNYKETEIYDAATDELLKDNSRVYGFVDYEDGMQYLFLNIYDDNGGGGGGDVTHYIERTVTKVWKGDIVNDRPDFITVEILKNGEVYETVILNADNNWQYEWTTVNDGTDWDVREINVPEGYESSMTVDNNRHWTITNTRIPNDPDKPGPDPTDNPGEEEKPGTEEPGTPVEPVTPEPDLGDAPKTGDSSNAVAYVMLMLFAMAGLIVTRRKLN
ncbi:MAG: Cna B-type domain-containing protein [Peptococcaceae bacterium]|nr:Cna B-type domain-containing protein [Peptococcaceae bacterium]